MKEEKKVNLDGIMYDEQGNFVPLVGRHGNISGELAHLRNTYMEAEKSYFEELLSDSKIREEFSKLVELESEDLFNLAMEIQSKLEFGTLETPEDLAKMQNMDSVSRDAYHMARLERAEGMMALLYAAAKDKVKLKQKIKLYEDSSNSKSR